MKAVGQIARWLEQAAPPRSGRATPYVALVRAIAWHLRVGGSWRALPGSFPAWRTVYGWFRKWQHLGLFDRLLGDVARQRRRIAGRSPAWASSTRRRSSASRSAVHAATTPAR